MTFQHRPGVAMECLSIPITVEKERAVDQQGNEVMRVGFSIAGGIDQDYTKSPQGYSDNGVYVTQMQPGGPAERSGLRLHDKILQCNGVDFTMVTHKKAVDYVKKWNTLSLLVGRAGVTEQLS